MNKTIPSASNYLACREAYQIELHRYSRLEKRLKHCLAAIDSGDLEQKMLLVRSQEDHPASTLIALYNEQGILLDKAASLFDTAEALQKQRAAAIHAAFHKDLLALEC